jgi:hypothetical protein
MNIIRNARLYISVVFRCQRVFIVDLVQFTSMLWQRVQRSTQSRVHKQAVGFDGTRIVICSVSVGRLLSQHLSWQFLEPIVELEWLIVHMSYRIVVVLQDTSFPIKIQ